MDFRTASIPSVAKTSTMSLVVVLTGSTSLSLRTRINDVPSVSRIHSATALNSPSSVMKILFLSSVFGKCMYTFAIASIPCSDMSDSRFASIHLRNTSSSILSTTSSSSCILLSSEFMILRRKTNFSALSSLKIQFKSSPKPAVIFSEIDSIVSFLSVILLRSSSIRSNHAEIFDTSKSGIS